MRRLALLFVLLIPAFWTGLVPASATDDGQMAQALVGRWEWPSQMNGAAVANQLTLVGDGTFAYTTRMQTYMVTSTGLWAVQGGWLGFKTTWSSALDPTGAPVGVAPIQILEVGPDYVRTPAGIARRTL